MFFLSFSTSERNRKKYKEIANRKRTRNTQCEIAILNNKQNYYGSEAFVIALTNVNAAILLQITCNLIVYNTVCMVFFFVIKIFICICTHTFPHCNIRIFADRERARYEATVRLGNASQFSQSDNRNDRRRMNEYLPTVLEKHVSIKKQIFHFMKFSGFYIIVFCCC